MLTLSRWALVCALFAINAAYAENETGKTTDTFRLSGNVRLYSFSRNFVNSQENDLHATSLGGKLKVETAKQTGIGAAAAVYFAQDIGFNNHQQDGKTINPLLMGKGYGIYVPGELYLQYRTPALLARIGNQKMDTPWANPADGFMIPNLYRGGVLTYSPFAGMKLEADRILRFKNRTSVGFDSNNLYALPYGSPHFDGSVNGAVDFGVKYTSAGPSGEAWVYRFQDIAQLAYAQAGYKYASSSVSPFVDVQAMRETGQGTQLLGTVDSKAYGAKVGIAWADSPEAAYFAYNKVPTQFAGGVNNGNLLSPYTQTYNTDPFYTTIMNYGMVSVRAPGHAWQLGSKLKLLDHRLDLSASLTRFMTAPYVENVNAFMMDAAWHLGGKYKGLSVRDRFGYEHGRQAWGSAYLDNRIMLQYAF